jgi:LPS export ABC transporter protein LptC
MADRLFYPLLIIFVLTSCNEIQQESDMPIYEGPILELTNTTSYYSDSSVVRIKLQAPKQLEFENNDREFKEGIYLEFYEPDGSLSSNLKANYCYYYAKEDKWRALGDVIVKNIANNEQLNTEELFWVPDDEIVYTNKFVRIETEGEIYMGEGMEAKQDFSWWRIENSRGTIDLNE